jgi:hypothetical protein
MAKGLSLIPERTKGVPNTFRRVSGDPPELSAFMRSFLNDNLAGYHSSSARLPIRFFIYSLADLVADELEMVMSRALEFLQFWRRLAVDTSCAKDSQLASLLKEPIDGASLLDFFCEPPRGLLPRCK